MEAVEVHKELPYPRESFVANVPFRQDSYEIYQECLKTALGTRRHARIFGNYTRTEMQNSNKPQNGMSTFLKITPKRECKPLLGQKAARPYLQNNQLIYSLIDFIVKH